MLDAGNSRHESEIGSTRIVKIDGRTGNARRVAELVRAFTAAMGGPLDSLKRDAVQRAAELQVIAEGMRKALLNGDHSINPEAVTKSENLADRARRALRIGDKPALTVRPMRERLMRGASA